MTTLEGKRIRPLHYQRPRAYSRISPPLGAHYGIVFACLDMDLPLGIFEELTVTMQKQPEMEFQTSPGQGIKISESRLTSNRTETRTQSDPY